MKRRGCRFPPEGGKEEGMAVRWPASGKILSAVLEG